ncbi:hypothetical protein [Streptomyces lushanensis]|uniref:hypothetical protein n=1 Tax=Streptomyces lushanensis TaxID=1434255 RepID=UPI000829F92D|nr:hypothetical protein [Streptomyces lushanensis]
MRAIRAASAALLGVAALALTAPTAVAAVDGSVTPFGFTVTPSTINPGGKVTLGVTKCSSPATASSGVFDTVTIPSGRTATATVDWDAKAGARYIVTFECNGMSAKTTLAISGSSSTRTPAPNPGRTTNSTTNSTANGTATRAATAPVSVSSPGGVRGGLGGSIGGLNIAEIVTGTALVVAGATGTVYAIRRRAVNRGH